MFNSHILSYFSSKTVFLKNHFLNKIILLLLITFISGCSTTKNTWASRTYHAVNTRFNVYFNGTVSYDEGLKNILKANKEDYSTIIPMYPISRHSNAKSAIPQMERTIEKSRKAIKLHSIKVKPERNIRKSNSPEYKVYYNQQEFNPELKKSWLLLAKAEFHKGDFLGSVGTFSYISKHYSTDRNMVAECQLWMARAYGEMGWLYEAEQMLSRLEQDNLNQSNIKLIASVNADILLKKQQYKEAIPFLELALSKEDDKDMEQRFSYLLAQLYQKTGNNTSAYGYFTKVVKLNPPYEMDFNARISRAQLETGTISSVRKDLRKMLKSSKNKDYLDQLYYALGNTYLHHADTLNAITNYKLSVEKSTRKGISKAVSLITLGDLYYAKRNYASAQPCYDDAAKIITNEHEDYDRVTKRAETLNELVIQDNIVQLQDSLQRLAALTESTRLEVIKKMIAKQIVDEKAAAEKVLKENQPRPGEGIEDFSQVPPIGTNFPGEWYFYNSEVMKTGQADFQKKWGIRKLEDNWRRTNKTTSLFNDESTASSTSVKDTIATTTTSKADVLSDTKNPEFYLKQIPVTPSQIAKSNTQIATALFSMGLIYKDKIEDLDLAVTTFKEFIRRFGSDERVPDAYFQLYLMETKRENQTEANFYRTKLITEFPNTKYQKILSDPNYAEQLAHMYREQDSIYSLTYKAYKESDYQTVFKQVAYIQQNYPLSTIMPKFLFLNALSIGKKDSPDKFETALNELITKYPESDVSVMAKDMLALMKQGRQAKTGTSSGSLLTRREEEVKSEIKNITTTSVQFSAEKQSKHRILLISSISATNMNKLLYNIASFNFSRFMIKDFDLVVTKLDSVKSVLSVTNFESYDEAEWYLNSIASDVQLTKLLSEFQVQKVIISEDNYALMRTSFNLTDYLAFQSQQLFTKQNSQITKSKSPKK